jgi:uncharacterized protein DUF4234
MVWGTPPGAGGPLSPGPGGVRAGVIKELNPVTVVALSLVTCGLYGAYWLYRTTGELRDALDDPSLKPGIDLLLSVVTCGLWAIYVQYRNARVLHGALQRFDPGARDHSTLVLLLNVAALLALIPWLVAMYILQDDQNRLARLAEGRSERPL